MILYKYLSLPAALAMIETSMLGFTQTSGLNDPTETTAGEHPGEKASFWGGTKRRSHVETEYAILTLTRNPLSLIMWSHYAKSHTGLVVGIDSKLAGIDDPDTCTLPAKYGSVIYTHSKPCDFYEHSEDVFVQENALAKFDPKNLEALQRVFLYKSGDWSYEEEVRSVKTIASIMNAGGKHLRRKICDESTCEKIEVGTKTLLLPIPQEAIKSVHVGIRSMDELEDACNYEGIFDIYSKIKAALPDVQLFNCNLDPTGWGMTATYLGESWSQAVQNIYDIGP